MSTACSFWSSMPAMLGLPLRPEGPWEDGVCAGRLSTDEGTQDGRAQLPTSQGGSGSCTAHHCRGGCGCQSPDLTQVSGSPALTAAKITRLEAWVCSS